MKGRLRQINYRQAISDNRIFVFIVALFVIVQAINPGFITANNVKIIFQNLSIEGMVAIGMAMLIILGEIDLSVGAIMSVSCCVSIYLQPYGILPAILASIGIGTLAGFLNGALVVKSGVSSLPITLGTMGLMNGIVYVVTESQSVPGTNKSFLYVADTMIGGINLVIYLFIALVVVFEFVLQKCYFGRSIMAVGGNRFAAEYVGLRVDRVRVLVFTLTGLLSSIAGVMTAARYNIASGHIGEQTALAVITAVLIGGISLSGGEGSITKAFFGYLFIISLQNAMRLLKFPPDLSTIITGALLIVILAIDAVTIRRNQFK
ncbi:MAG: ABC transporter permease [Clostridiales Family XIII bacterium]|jgi:ribose transport system permease protein|nr:ABC transporter permease [Clostridiales Family XIII bacterium]